MLLEGLFLPLTTPFSPDGRLNIHKLVDNVRRYSKTPAAGLAVLSAIGQPSLLSDAETRDTLKAVAESASSEKVLLAGVARDSATQTLELIAYAAEMGFDAALVPVPSMLRGERATARALLTFYQVVADQAALPLLLDSGQEASGGIAVDLVLQLSQHTNIIGLVDSGEEIERISDVLRSTTGIKRDVTVTNVFGAVTGRMLAKSAQAAQELVSVGSLTGGGAALSVSSSASTLRTRTKTVSFQVLCGRTAGVLDALAAGASGAVLPLAAAAPQACYEVLAAWKDGDPALAKEKQERLLLHAATIEEKMGAEGIKFACDLNGYFGGRPRLPGLPLTGAEREAVELLMRGIRN